MPKKKPRYLKFKFEVNLVVPVIGTSTNLPNGRKKVVDSLKYGDFVLNVGDLSQARVGKGDPATWPAYLAWTCPGCGEERWFTLGVETCTDWCPRCQKTYIIIEGYIKREEGGCNACGERINCLLIPHAKPVTVEQEDSL